jgi:hypothetical protein
MDLGDLVHAADAHRVELAILQERRQVLADDVGHGGMPRFALVKFMPRARCTSSHS